MVLSLQQRKKAFFIVIFILLVIAWIAFISKIQPKDMVQIIGITNGYIFAFVIAFLSGIVILFPAPYYLVIITLGAGGLNPFILGGLSAAGAIAGDSLVYLFGYSGSALASQKVQKAVDNIFAWANRRNYATIAFLFFIYGAIIPLPNNVITAPLGLARYSYWKLMVPLAIGNVVFNIGLALAGFYGWNKLV